MFSKMPVYLGFMEKLTFSPRTEAANFIKVVRYFLRVHPCQSQYLILLFSSMFHLHGSGLTELEPWLYVSCSCRTHCQHISLSRLQEHRGDVEKQPCPRWPAATSPQVRFSAPWASQKSLNQLNWQEMSQACQFTRQLELIICIYIVPQSNSCAP